MNVIEKIKEGFATFVVVGTLASGFAIAANVAFGQEDCSDAQATAGLCSKDMSSTISSTVPASDTATSNSSTNTVPQATSSTPQASVPAASSATSGSTAATSSTQAQPASTTPTTAAPALFTLEEAKTWCVTGNTKSECDKRMELIDGGQRAHLKTGSPVEVSLKSAGVCASVYNAQDQTTTVIAPMTGSLSLKEMTVTRCGSSSVSATSAPASASASASAAVSAPPVYVVPGPPAEAPQVINRSSAKCDPIAAFGGGTWSPVEGGTRAWLYIGKSLPEDPQTHKVYDTVPDGWVLDVDGPRLVPGDKIWTTAFTARCLSR